MVKAAKGFNQPEFSDKSREMFSHPKICLHGVGRNFKVLWQKGLRNRKVCIAERTRNLAQVMIPLVIISGPKTPLLSDNDNGKSELIICVTRQGSLLSCTKKIQSSLNIHIFSELAK